MRIERERPSQRRHHRLTAPLSLTLDGKNVRVRNWSLGGMLIDRFGDDWPDLASRWTCHLSLPFQGFDIGFSATFEVLRLEKEAGAVAGRFIDLGEREEELLSHFAEQLVRGAMVATHDTIQRIDVPVTPVSTKPDPNPTQTIPVRRWPVKTIAYTAMNVLLGLLVFGYLGLTVLAALTRIETDAAVVATTTQTMTAPAEGRIVQVLFERGQPFKAGDTLAVFKDRDLERHIVNAQADLENAKARYAEQIRLLRDTATRRQGYDLIADNNINQLKSLIDSLERQLVIVERKFTSTKDLVDKGWANQQMLDTAESDVIEARSNLERKRIHLSELQTLRQTVGTIQLSSDARLIDEADTVSASLARAEQEVNAAFAHLEALKDLLGDTKIVAPWDGRILRLMKPTGSDVRYGEDVMILSERQADHIKVFLTQDQVEQVRVGSHADILITAEDIWLKGRVTSLDRTDGFFDEVAGEYAWRSPTAKTSLAIVTLDKSSTAPPGAPAIVILQKRSGTPALRFLQSLFARTGP